jgi:hypothetical protein
MRLKVPLAAVALLPKMISVSVLVALAGGGVVHERDEREARGRRAQHRKDAVPAVAVLLNRKPPPAWLTMLALPAGRR